MFYLNLFFTFFKIGICTIGGGYSSLPLIESFVVNGNNWITMNEFMDIISISEMTPGPFAINCATFVGIKTGGIIGAIIATLGFIAPSLIIVILLAYFYKKYKNLSYVKGTLKALKPCVIAIILCSGISIFLSVIFQDSSIGFTTANIDYIAICVFIIVFIAIQKFRLNPIIAIVTSGIVGAVAYEFIPIGA